MMIMVTVCMEERNEPETSEDDADERESLKATTTCDSECWDVREEGRLTDGVSTSGVEAAITIATKENGEDED